MSSRGSWKGLIFIPFLNVSYVPKGERTETAPIGRYLHDRFDKMKHSPSYIIPTELPSVHRQALDLAVPSH